MKLSKTEKMTCLIRPWKWNSINRSLKSKKMWMSRKKSQKSSKFLPQQKNTVIIIYIACINHWYIVSIWLEFVWLASFLKHYSTISTFFFFVTQLNINCTCIMLSSIKVYKKNIEFVYELELFYIIQNTWKVCWNIAFFYQLNNECIKKSWIFFIGKDNSMKKSS